MLRRFLSGIIALAALLFILALPAAAQQRIALVIGNAAYPKGPLATALADGGLVAEALTSIGFEIVEGADVNQTDLRRVFRDFLAKVEAAGPDAIAFVYYTGYAIQFEGDNYLIPVDARLDRDSDIPIDTVRLFDLLRPLADAPAAAKIVVLDATRPLPFQIQGGQLARGLGAIEAAPGLLVAFSSAPATLAADGPGPYGAYATAIAEMVREPGLDIDTMFARIRLRTNEATNGAQTPWEVSLLQQVVMLVQGQAAAPPPGAPQGIISAPQTAIGAPVVRRRPPPRPIQEIGPEEAYAYAVEQDELPVYVEYVRAYPNSAYAQRVWATIRARREALLWRRALLENSPDAYWTYIERYPDGMYVFDARRRLRRLAAGDRPPSGWRMRNYDDVPMPLAGEPARMYDVYPAAPPPRRYLAPPPAFIVGLPPPRRDQGLWRRPQPAFPVIVTPPPGPRPGFGPGGRPPGVGVISPPGAPPGQPQQGFPKGPAVVNQPPSGGPPPGFKGPPQPGQPKGPAGPAVVNQPPPGAPPGGSPPGFRGPRQQDQPKGPAVVNQPPPGAPPGGPPPGTKGPPQQGQPKGPAVVNQPPPGAPPGGPPPGTKGPPQQGQPKGPAVVNQPPPGGPPPGYKGPPQQGQPKGPAVVNQPPPGPPPGGPPPGTKGPPQQGQPKGPAVVNQPPPGAPSGGPPPGTKGPPQEGQPKGPAVVNQPPPGPPPGGPPKGYSGPPPKGPAVVNQPPAGVKGPPPQQTKGPPPGQQLQQPKAPQVAAPPPPRAPVPPAPPQVKGPPPGPPPSAGGPKGPPPGPPQAQKGPPPQAQKGALPKCAVVQGKQPCAP